MSEQSTNQAETSRPKRRLFSFRLLTLLVFMMVLGPLIGMLYLHWPRDIYANVDYNTFQGVGAIDPSHADHVTDLLDANGIPNIIEGSVVYGISVPPEHVADAKRIVEADATAKGYTFYTGDK